MQTYRVGFTLLLFAQPKLILHNHCSLRVGNILRFLPFGSAVLEPDLDLIQTCRQCLMMLIMENTIVGHHQHSGHHKTLVTCLPAAG